VVVVAAVISLMLNVVLGARPVAAVWEHASNRKRAPLPVPE